MESTAECPHMPDDDTMRPTLTYILPNKMGGVFTYVRNLLRHRSDGPFKVQAILTHYRGDEDDRPADSLPVDREIHFQYDPLENLYAMIKRLRRQVPPGPGVIVTNDWLELAMLSVHDPGKMVVNITHGDYAYYYDLARKHEAVIDWFVAPSRYIADRLREAMPQRRELILHLPLGVTIPKLARSGGTGPLRAMFVGRLAINKGIFDLPEIDRRLRARNVKVEWTVVGKGPEEGRLRELWAWNPSVCWKGNVSNEEVMDLYLAHDVFVLSTRAEGFPVTVVEAAAAGVVMVVSDLPSGIPEVVIDGSTGFRASFDDLNSFVSAVERLHHDRLLLERMSAAARKQVAEKFDLERNVKQYDALYKRFAAGDRARRPRCGLQYGSRLDRPWIPNLLVRTIRSIRNR
jgi:glycosyltransferase involved in cell wall biosynthesis